MMTGAALAPIAAATATAIATATAALFWLALTFLVHSVRLIYTSHSL
jgi:hypothetical protein